MHPAPAYTPTHPHIHTHHADTSKTLGWGLRGGGVLWKNCAGVWFGARGRNLWIRRRVCSEAKKKGARGGGEGGGRG